jgi:hypothetical protein
MKIISSVVTALPDLSGNNSVTDKLFYFNYFTIKTNPSCVLTFCKGENLINPSLFESEGFREGSDYLRHSSQILNN